MAFVHIGFNVTDYQSARKFFVDALAPLDIAITHAFGSGPDGHNLESVCHAPEG